MIRTFVVFSLILSLSFTTSAVAGELEVKLNIAAMDGNVDVVKDLLNKGADVNARGYMDVTALMFAADNGHEEVVRVLLSKGADIKAKDRNGLTALMYATNKGYTTVVKVLNEFHARTSVGTVSVGKEANARYAGEKPSLVVRDQKRIGDWIRINVELRSKTDTTAIFKPSEVVLRLSDGSNTRDWYSGHFFAAGNVNLMAGDRMGYEVQHIGGKDIHLTQCVTEEGSQATVEIQLQSGVTQKAQLYFKSLGKAQARTLSLGSLNAKIAQSK